jgi:MATE family, multidrug efflux pump
MIEGARAVSSPVTHRTVLAIAVPIIFSNITTPLVGLVDTAVLGQLQGAHYIGAAALGATIFTFLFWAFGFLRMGTTGLTAQAYGAADAAEVGASLGRALLIAAAAGGLLVLLQWPLGTAALALADASEAVETGTAVYFDIRVWSAPAALANYALAGWLIGLQRTRTALAIQLFLNGLNAILDVLFVLGWGWGVAGVAMGTLLAEVAAAALGLAVAAMILAHGRAMPTLEQVIRPAGFRRALSVNRDIMIRTLALLAAFSWFIFQSAPTGDATLAANALLMQLVGFSAYLLDGFAFAAETLVGAAIGARRRDQFQQAVALSSLWAGVIALVLGVVLVSCGVPMIDTLSVDPEVRSAARDALYWAALVPVLGVAAYQLDGIYIGATRTMDMRNMMLLSAAAFFVAWHILVPQVGNDGRWLSLLTLNVVRAVSLAVRYPALVAEAFATSPAALPSTPPGGR